MRTSIPFLFNSYEKKKELNKNVKDLSPAMNNDKETEKLIKTYKENRIKWDENENNNYTFLSNLEEIVYNPSPVYNKSNNSNVGIKKLNDNKMLDKYMDLFEP